MTVKDFVAKAEEMNDQVHALHEEVITLETALNELNKTGDVEDVKMAELYLIATSIRETIEVMKYGN